MFSVATWRSNVTLTAVNSVIAVVTLPIVTNLAFDYFDPDAVGVGRLAPRRDTAGIRDRPHPGRLSGCWCAVVRLPSRCGWIDRSGSGLR